MTADPEAAAAIAARALPLVDLTNLDEACTEDDVRELWHEATTPFGPVAAVCIWPRFVAVARDQRRNDPEDARAGGIRIATVVNFPTGGETRSLVVMQARSAVQVGADEVGLVLPYRCMLTGADDAARDMVRAVADASGEAARVKIILETGELKEPDAIRRASRIAIEAGADFLETSTGRTEASATPEAARIMLEEISQADRPVGLKPSGGIRTVADAGRYLALADEIMGEGWARPETFRFGASRLLGSLIAAFDRGAGGGPAPGGS